MVGDLQLAPTAVFRTNFKQIESLLEQGGGGQSWSFWYQFLAKQNPCCGDGGHVTNQGEKDFYEEFLSAEKRLLDAAAAGDRTREAKVIDLCKLFGSAETPLQELTTPDGTSVWAGDGVHLTSPAYRVAARAGRRAGAVGDGRGGRACDQKAKARKRGPSPRAAACEAGGQSAAADTEAGGAAAVVVRTAPLITEVQQQQGQRVRQGLRRRPWRRRPGMEWRPRRQPREELEPC
jgi:hypothetical protein